MTGSCLASYVSGFDSKSYHSKREFGEVSYNMTNFFATNTPGAPFTNMD